MPHSDHDLSLEVTRDGQWAGTITWKMFADQTCQIEQLKLNSPTDGETAQQLLSDLRTRCATSGIQIVSIDIGETRLDLGSANQVLSHSKWRKLPACVKYESQARSLRHLFPNRCLAEQLILAGFQRMHDLLVLVAQISRVGDLAPLDDWQIQPCDPCQREILTSVLAGTLLETLDFPKLQTDVSPEAVLQRIEAGDDFEQCHWFLVGRGGPFVGCFLLKPNIRQNRGELTYMGLVPSERGRGGGLLMAKTALHHARRIGWEQLLLGVDAENDPALAVYARAGFTEAERRCVYYLQVDANK